MNIVCKRKIQFLGVQRKKAPPPQHHGHLGPGSLDGGLVLKSNGPWFVLLASNWSLEISSGKAEGCLQERDEKPRSALQ